MANRFGRAIAEWSCVIAGAIDFGDDALALVRWCVGEIIQGMAKTGPAKWLANGNSRDRLDAASEVAGKLVEILGAAGASETEDEFDALVSSVRECLTNNTASLEEAARDVIYTGGLNDKINESQSQALIARVTAANLVSPVQVTDMVLDAGKMGGWDAAIAELERCKSASRSTTADDSEAAKLASDSRACRDE